MFSIKADSAASVCTESRVFLPLEPGIHPFPIKRAPVHLPPIFAKPRYEIDDEQELAVLSEVKPTPKFASMVLGIAKVFRRHHVDSTPFNVVKFEPTWFTSPDNWRPGLVTLEQAASREEIVRRPEAFERV